MMRPGECPRDEAVLEAIADGAWPDGAPASLRAHVEACDTCRDLAEVATLLHHDRQELVRDVPVPSAGAVWWRARLRARAEAEHTAIRPILTVAACGATVLLALVAALLTMGWPWGSAVLADGMDAIQRLQPSVRVSLDVAALLPWLLERWLLPTMLAALLLLAAPLALYVAARD